MKLFISQPMNGKNEKEIKDERHGILETMKYFLGEATGLKGRKIEEIPSFFASGQYTPIECLGRSIILMSQADVVYFAKGWEKARGCKIEHAVAEGYGLKIIKGETSYEDVIDILKQIINNTQPPKETEKDMVNHPSHYCRGGIETIDYLKAFLTPEEYRGYLKGTMLTYISRAPWKENEAQDYAKAAWYADRLKKETENKNETE